MRPLRLLAFVGVAHAAASCGAILSADDPVATADGGADGSVVDSGGGEPAIDAATAADADAASDPFAYHPACPRPAPPGAACTAAKESCTRRLLHRPITPSHPWGIAVDDQNVYWLTQPYGVDGYNGHADASLWRVDRSTGTAVELARAQPKARSLVAHKEHLYWLTGAGGSGELRRLRRDAPPCTPFSCAKFEIVESGIADPLAVSLLSPDALLVTGGLGRIDVVSLGQPPARATAVTTTINPAAIAGDGVAFAGGGNLLFVHRISLAGADAGVAASFPDDASVGAPFQLATDCTDLFASHGNRLWRVPASPAGGLFATVGDIDTGGLYAMGNDQRFVYLGYANGGGLARVDTKAMLPSRQVMVPSASAWRIDVQGDVIAYGEHGASPADPGSDVGAIFLIEK